VSNHGLRFFEDYLPGASYDCGTVRIDEDSIISFAKEFDPQPFHVDPAAAASGPFGGLIASGWHTAAATMRLLVASYLPDGASLGAAGIDELRWPHPVRPGDTLAVRATVLEARPSRSKPDRGIVRTEAEAKNQDGLPVLRLTAINFIRVRAAGPG
jgi:acyl dehydratase